MKEIPHVVIEFPDYFPKDFDVRILDGIQNEMLDLRIERKEPTFWAASEWIIPGIIAVYILKPYFESFLKEAGKDHYQLLKKKLNEILSESKKMEVKTITSSESTEKIDRSNTQSKAVSIFIQTEKGIMIKLLYDNKLELETWLSATDIFLNLVEGHYNKTQANPLSQYLNQLDEDRNNTIYAIIDPETKNWKLISNLGQFIQEQRNKD